MKFTAVVVLFLGLMSTSQAIEEKSITSLNALADLQTEDQAGKPPCVYLDETAAELAKQVDLFSKTLDMRHWTNAVNIQQAIAKKTGQSPKLTVHTWELFDKAFSFPRVRRYQYVNENMDMLEHFQDNWNTNISNEINKDRFMRVAKTVRDNLNAKYHDGEFADPALTAYPPPPPAVY